ncbi:hypothetical protein VTI74DRAFT_10224 [Chaetomium olivicolor]
MVLSGDYNESSIGSWLAITKHFPGLTVGLIEVRYYTRLKTADASQAPSPVVGDDGEVEEWKLEEIRGTGRETTAAWNYHWATPGTADPKGVFQKGIDPTPAPIQPGESAPVIDDLKTLDVPAVWGAREGGSMVVVKMSVIFSVVIFVVKHEIP